jgi:hypothetical protein
VAFAAFDANIHCLNDGEFDTAQNAPPTPSAALLLVNSDRVISVAAALLRCIPPPSRPAVFPLSEERFSARGVKTARRPPPSCTAALLLILPDVIDSCAAPVASTQPPKRARFSVQIVVSIVSDDELCAAIAPPPPSSA